jgi:hypothetical protein
MDESFKFDYRRNTLLLKDGPEWNKVGRYMRLQITKQVKNRKIRLAV